MSNKIKIILIAIVAIILLLIGIYFFNKSRGIPVGDPNVSVYQKFNPFGSASDIINNLKNNDTTNNTTNKNSATFSNSRFHKITEFAVSGAAYFEEKKEIPIVVNNTIPNIINNTKINKIATNQDFSNNYEIIPSIRYVEKATGHIFQMSLKTRAQGEVSNTTIPGVNEALFNNNTNSVIYRYVAPGEKSITSFLANLGGQSSFLDYSITQIALSKDKSKFFSLIEKPDGVVGIVRSFGDLKSNQIFSSAFSEWLPQWVLDENIYLTTKPSYLIEGNMYNLNIKNSTLTKIFGGIKGLTTLSSNDGNYVLFGASLDTGPKLNIFDIKNHRSIDLNKFGFPEKCVWSNNNIDIYCAIPNEIKGDQYPDSWYQGSSSFTDWFAKINTITKETETLANSSSEVPVDATNLFLTKSEDGLFFINKKDGTLWKLDL